MRYLAVHIDTTGINYDSHDPSDGHEIVAICLMSCDEDFNILAAQTVYNGSVKADKLKASEQYHGINSAIMQEVGYDTEEEFAFEILSFMVEHFIEEGFDPIKCLGHNVATFTLPFLRKLMDKYDAPVAFSSNVLDTHSVLVPTVGDVTLKQIIEIFGDGDNEDEYSTTCYKCKLFVNIFKRVKQLWTKKVLK